MRTPSESALKAARKEVARIERQREWVAGLSPGDSVVVMDSEGFIRVDRVKHIHDWVILERSTARYGLGTGCDGPLFLMPPEMVPREKRLQRILEKIVLEADAFDAAGLERVKILCKQFIEESDRSDPRESFREHLREASWVVWKQNLLGGRDD